MRQTAFLTAFFSLVTVLPAADPVLLNMIMPDAQVVGGVNVTRAETSPFGQFVLRSMTSDSNFEKFVTASGFDPRTDLTEFLFATNGTANMGVAVARGKFDAPKIAAAATLQGNVASTVYSGARLLVTAGPKGSAMAIYPDSAAGTIALAGDLASVKSALDRRNVTNAVNPLLASKIAMYGSSDAWTVSIASISALAGSAPKNNPLHGALSGDLLKKVQQTSGGITFGSAVRITGEAVANTPQDASALGDVIKFVASMAQSSAGAEQAGIADLVQTLDVTTVSNTVTISLSIPEAQLEMMMHSSAKTHKAGII